MATELQLPKQGGRSRQGVPVRGSHRLALTKVRSSRRERPPIPCAAGKCSCRAAHWSFVRSWRWRALKACQVIEQPCARALVFPLIMVYHFHLWMNLSRLNPSPSLSCTATGSGTGLNMARPNGGIQRNCIHRIGPRHPALVRHAGR